MCSSDLPTPGVGKTSSLHKPSPDAFVAKIAPSGTVLWASYLGGSMDDNSGATLDDKAGDFGKSVAVDELGFIYLTGWTESTANPINMCGPLATPDAISGTAPCPYVIPFPATVNAYMGNLPQDSIATCGTVSIPDPDCVAPNRRLHAAAYVIKFTSNGELAATPNRDTLLAAFPRGNAVAASGTSFATYLGGYGDDAGFAIVVDSLHNVYVGGVGESINFPGPMLCMIFSLQ